VPQSETLQSLMLYRLVGCRRSALIWISWGDATATTTGASSPGPQLGPVDTVDAFGDDNLDMLPVAGAAPIDAGAVPPAHPVTRSP
jgi:hypothetical protein